jgi:hypothetical protein
MRCMTHTARQPDGQTLHELPLDASTCNRFYFVQYSSVIARAPTLISFY